MAANQDYTEDMAQGDFSNEGYGDFQQTSDSQDNGGAEQNGNEAMEEATNGDGHHDSSSHGGDRGGKDEDR